MREIKFRQWDSVNKIMHYDIGATPGCWTGFPKVSWERYPIMQFTGLRDKNGKEIYEGDILHFKIEMPYGWDSIGNEITQNEEFNSVVTFEDGAFGCVIDSFGDCWLPFCNFENQFDIEVIGNIFENGI